MSIALILSQTVDPFSGGAGWAGAGLLGLVLGWLLLVHIPAKDKQIKDLIKDFTDQLKLSNDAHEVLEKENRTLYMASLKTVTDHCKEEMDRVISIYSRNQT